MIKVTCSSCGIVILVPTTVQGRPGICFGCGAHLQVPIPSESIESLDLNFPTGATISDRYIIEEPIGEGGMGIVYLAYDTLVNEEIALKFMKPRLLRTQKGQSGFIQEAQIARRLRHENIVAVHDLGWTEEGILYITMEFLKGQSLRSLLRKQRHDRRFVDIRLAISVISQVLTALDHAHRTVVHRDLKPENIFVMAGEHVKVLDFGLAKAIHEENLADTASMMSARFLETRSSNSQRLVGTWAYSAPEQKRRRTVDARADIYAVGLILYEMLTLRTPFDKQVNVEDVRHDVSPSVLAVLNRALAHECEDRWQTADEFQRHLLMAFEQSYRQVHAKNEETAPGRTASVEGMVYLDGGSFLMGNNSCNDEAPEFEANVKPFFIDKHPVTVAQYAQFLEETDYPPPKFWLDSQFDGPNQPVVGVSWPDANAYAAWAGKLLPTETQWEFAARGKENRKYPWGNRAPDSNLCNFGDYLSVPSIVTMHEEGQTPHGVCDLAGNVFEWTRDFFLPYPGPNAGPESAKTQSKTSPLRAVRGGCWCSGLDELRCSYRRGLFPEAKLATVGFRCVVPAERQKVD